MLPAMPADLPRTIADAAHLVETRALSPVDLVRALVERIGMFDPVISSFLTVTADEALAQARHAESEIAKGHYRGALRGVPAIVVPSGYSVPLSIQLVGKPFDDARLLGIAHAYEQATRFAEQRQPNLAKAEAPQPIAAPPKRAGTDASAPVSNLCEQAAVNAGLKLNDEQLAILCGAAPHVVEMLQRVRSAAGSAEPASVFVAGDRS
jgi:Amidase